MADSADELASCPFLDLHFVNLAHSSGHLAHLGSTSFKSKSFPGVTASPCFSSALLECSSFSSLQSPQRAYLGKPNIQKRLQISRDSRVQGILCLNYSCDDTLVVWFLGLRLQLVRLGVDAGLQRPKTTMYQGNDNGMHKYNWRT